MSNELAKVESKQIDIIEELNQTNALVENLMKTKHYAKIGPEGIYAIVQKAKSMGLNPLDALNGGIYSVSGKLEMSSQMMNRVIRSKGHSIQKDDKSTKTNCILHGKRADNGDRWTVSFGVEDAKRAGLCKPNGPWEKYPEAMCFARALSMLARQLFPDIICDCFVQGEISDAPPMHSPVIETITGAQLSQIESILSQDLDPNEALGKLLKKANCYSLSDMHPDKFHQACKWLCDRQLQQTAVVEVQQPVAQISSMDELADENSQLPFGV